MVALTHSAQQKPAFLVKTKEKSTLQRKIPKKKVYLGLLHQRLGHRSTRSLLAGDTANIWQDIELRVYPDPFCTSCQISTINKKPRSKSLSNPKTPFKWLFMGIIPSISPKSFIKDTTFDKLLLNCGCLIQTSKSLWNGKISLLKK